MSTEEVVEAVAPAGRLPWHHAAWRVVVALGAVALLAFGVGLLAGGRDDAPGADALDVRFLRSMRAHHDQAVEMALPVLRRPDADPTLRTIATEILLGQQLESGLMVQLLRSWGHAEQADEGGPAMPGMATEAEVAELREATGVEADLLFVRLMTRHHEGGISMAGEASAEAGTDEVRDLAGGMVRGQRADLAELAGVAARLEASGGASR